MNRNFLWRTVATGIVAATIAFALGCQSKMDVKSGGTKSNANLRNEPSVTFAKLDGGDMPLGSLKGKVVLVNFWATWCEPCRDEIPDLIELQKQYAGKGFTVIGVAMDKDGKKVVQPFVEKTLFSVNGQQSTMTYPIVLGTTDDEAKFGNLFGYPTSFLISRDGKMVERILGGIDKSELEKKIQQQLAQS